MGNSPAYIEKVKIRDGIPIPLAVVLLAAVRTARSSCVTSSLRATAAPVPTCGCAVSVLLAVPCVGALGAAPVEEALPAQVGCGVSAEAVRPLIRYAPAALVAVADISVVRADVEVGPAAIEAAERAGPNTAFLAVLIARSLFLADGRLAVIASAAARAGSPATKRARNTPLKGSVVVPEPSIRCLVGPLPATPTTSTDEGA